MLLSRKLVALLFAGALGGATADQPLVAHRLLAWPATAGTSASVVPPFALFGWITPPDTATTEPHVAEMAAAGLNVYLPAWADSGWPADNLRRLDLAAAHGMRCIVWDRRFDRVVTLGESTAAAGAVMDSIVADYQSHPAFFGYYLGDEPDTDQWAPLGRLFAGLRARDPAHPAWNNLRGPSAYPDREAFVGALRGYIDAVHPAVLSDDHYDFRVTGDGGLFFVNLAVLNAVARGAGLPFWNTVLLIGHTGFRQPTPAELTWQSAMSIAYGARGVGWFTWWTPGTYYPWRWNPAVIDSTGRRTPWYDVVVPLGARLRAAGDTLAGSAWLAATHAGGTPDGGTPFVPDADVAAVTGRAVLGTFATATGARRVIVVNADSARAQRVTLVAARALEVARLEAGGWGAAARIDPGAPIALDLAAGDFVVLQMHAFDSVAGGLAPLLEVRPLPARGQLTLSIRRLGAGGRVEIIDGAGRRVWSRRVGPENTTIVWHGEREGDGRAPPGVYFVRAETPRGVAVARSQWLGGP